MQIPNIYKAGSPVLKNKAAEVVNFGSQELNDLVETMFVAMQHYQGVGLAAPQIGISQRILVYGVNQNKRYPNTHNIENTVLINPKIIWESPEQDNFMEGCLSIPNIRANVTRSSSIKVLGQDLLGHEVHKEVSGLEARIILHEIDHLDGILFLSKVDNMDTLEYYEVAS